MVLLEFRFARVLGSLPTTQDGLQGVDGICDASLASRDCTLSTGGAQESYGAVYWAIALASIVTLERCRRSCGGALSRNLHRGSINL